MCVARRIEIKLGAIAAALLLFKPSMGRQHSAICLRVSAAIGAARLATRQRGGNHGEANHDGIFHKLIDDPIRS